MYSERSLRVVVTRQETSKKSLRAVCTAEEVFRRHQEYDMKLTLSSYCTKDERIGVGDEET